MENLDKLKREIKSMDKKTRNELLSALDLALSDSQKENLKKMLTEKNGKAELENQLKNVNIDKLISKTSSKEDILNLISQPDVKNKIKDILG